MADNTYLAVFATYSSRLVFSYFAQMAEKKKVCLGCASEKYAMA